MRNIMILILALAMLLGCIPVLAEDDTMDIFLIGGQSNAVGFSAIRSMEAIREQIPELVNGGFSHVHYAGSSRYGAIPVSSNEKGWGNTSTGCGATGRYIGPELGMAQSLSRYYNAETGRHAGIIKFAHGGSSLLDVSVGENATGNWVSPSYAAYLNTSYADEDITGGYYRLFLAQVKKNISQIKEYSGHTKINIVGMYWMQGESDIYDRKKYETSFTFFVQDLRKDLAEIMLEFTDGESDCGASNMPILIGSISEGFAVVNSQTAKRINRPFIELQKTLSETIENCYFVDNSKYLISQWNQDTYKVDILGSDQYHWNQDDMIQSGSNVGETFLRDVLKVKE